MIFFFLWGYPQFFFLFTQFSTIIHILLSLFFDKILLQAYVNSITFSSYFSSLFAIFLHFSLFFLSFITYLFHTYYNLCYLFRIMLLYFIDIFRFLRLWKLWITLWITLNSHFAFTSYSHRVLISFFSFFLNLFC